MQTSMWAIVQIKILAVKAKISEWILEMRSYHWRPAVYLRPLRYWKVKVLDAVHGACHKVSDPMACTCKLLDTGLLTC